MLNRQLRIDPEGGDTPSADQSTVKIEVT